MLAVLTDALLREKDRTGRLDLNDGADDSHDDERNKAAQKARKYVKDSLHEDLNGRCIINRCRKDGSSADLLGESLYSGTAHIRNMIMCGHGHRSACIHKSYDLFVIDRSIDID